MVNTPAAKRLKVVEGGDEIDGKDDDGMDVDGGSMSGRDHDGADLYGAVTTLGMESVSVRTRTATTDGDAGKEGEGENEDGNVNVNGGVNGSGVNGNGGVNGSGVNGSGGVNGIAGGGNAVREQETDVGGMPTENAVGTGGGGGGGGVGGGGGGGGNGGGVGEGGRAVADDEDEDDDVKELRAVAKRLKKELRNAHAAANARAMKLRDAYRAEFIELQGRLDVANQMLTDRDATILRLAQLARRGDGGSDGAGEDEEDEQL
jgi:hypothetical protein